MPTETDLENKYDNGAGQAAHLLKFYLRMVARSAGVNWDSDNDAEVDAIVECILNAARKQAHEEIQEWVRPDAQVHP